MHKANNVEWPITNSSHRLRYNLLALRARPLGRPTNTLET